MKQNTKFNFGNIGIAIGP